MSDKKGEFVDFVRPGCFTKIELVAKVFSLNDEVIAAAAD